MTDVTKFLFTNLSGPKAYDELFVPVLFEPWAKLLLDEVKLQSGEAVLDVATGPGTVARLAAVRLGSQGRIVATDISVPMLDVAKAKPAVAGAAQIEYVESPAAPLAAPSATFDVVLCQQGLQFFPDRPGALREMHRVLKPNGRVAIAVWAQLERNQIAAAFHAALRATVPAELASLMTAPYSWPSGSALKDAAEEAGFREIRLLTPTLPMTMWVKPDRRIFAHSFLPAASPKALTRISREIRHWALHHRSDKSLSDLAAMYNPCIRGWINYYSHFYPTQLRPTLRRIDAYVIRWARRKYKRMVHWTKGARDWFDRLRRAKPALFAHWPLCHGNGRTSGAV